MITGAHAIIFTPDPQRLRAFVPDVLGFSAVDAGAEWFIFALPPAELAVHPAEDPDHHHELSLICDDIHATVNELKQKGVEFTRPVSEQRWGLLTAFAAPAAASLRCTNRGIQPRWRLGAEDRRRRSCPHNRHGSRNPRNADRLLRQPRTATGDNAAPE